MFFYPFPACELALMVIVCSFIVLQWLNQRKRLHIRRFSI